MFSRSGSSLLAFIVFLMTYTPFVLATGPYTSTGDIFGGVLKGLVEDPGTNKAPHLGGQSGVHCCMLAVNESIGIEDGNLVFLPGQTALRGNASEFLRYQFPCTASYNGSAGSVPQVWVSYSWCSTRCPGWGLSKTTKSLSQWVQPFIQFITPSIVFVLNIPRRRRLNVPRKLFPRSVTTIGGAFSIVFKIIGASLIVTVDTILWLAILLAFSGPIILSGFYEALLDLRLLRFLHARVIRNGLTVRDRAHILFIILLGNLDQQHAWTACCQAVAKLPELNVRNQSRRRRSSALSTLATQSQVTSTVNQTQDSGADDEETNLAIATTKVKLKGMLESQVTFGSSVGAAIIFYTGSFCYTLIEIESTFGNNGASHRLGFGMFWMIIPHIAVASSLLLAGSNPNTWTAVSEGTYPEAKWNHEVVDTVSTTHGSARGSSPASTKVDHEKSFKLFSAVYQPVYKSQYQPVWAWKRGVSKARWIARLVRETPRLNLLANEVLKVSASEWVFWILCPAVLIVIIPAFCGALVSYTTPRVGLSCRSMTMLMYACSQIVLMILWQWNLVLSTVIDDQSTTPRKQSKHLRVLKTLIWCVALILPTTLALFTSIGGTMFFLMGLYTNCLCKIPIYYWSTRFTNPQARSALSSGNAEQIYYAQTFWFPTGVAATVFLIAFTYIGWWYQRGLRGKFKDLVEQIDYTNTEVIIENAEDEIGHP